MGAVGGVAQPLQVPEQRRHLVERRGEQRHGLRLSVADEREEGVLPLGHREGPHRRSDPTRGNR